MNIKINTLESIEIYLNFFSSHFRFIYNTHLREPCSLIVCTSGSSGYPKLARISHLQQLQSFAWIRDFDSESFTFNMISCYWASGLNALVYHVLHGQKRLITSKPYTPDLLIDLIEKYQLNSVFLVPPHLSILVESPRFQSADFSSIKQFVTGGLYVSENLRVMMQEKLPNGVLKVGYGMSEFGGILAETGNEFQKSSSVGVPSLNTEIKIQLDDGTTGGIREIGEILVRHPVKFLGYFNGQNRTIVDDEGWLHTGDMGYIDESHELNIIGQRIFAIKNFYNEIFPCEIEDKIERIPGVKQVVVVGVPDSIEIELTTALIVKDENSGLTEDIVYRVTSDLPGYKQLHGGIFFIDALPLTNSGKIQRKEAKELAAKLKVERNLLPLNGLLLNGH